MARYYFDMREGDQIAPDEEGMELRTMEACKRKRPAHWPTWQEMPSEAAPTDRDTRCRLRSETRPGR